MVDNKVKIKCSKCSTVFRERAQKVGPTLSLTRLHCNRLMTFDMASENTDILHCRARSKSGQCFDKGKSHCMTLIVLPVYRPEEHYRYGDHERQSASGRLRRPRMSPTSLVNLTSIHGTNNAGCNYRSGVFNLRRAVVAPERSKV